MIKLIASITLIFIGSVVGIVFGDTLVNHLAKKIGTV